MALFKICRGAETNLPTTLTSGYCYFCTDTTNFYIDYTDPYGALTRAKIASKYADKLRYTEDDNFIELDPTDIVTKSNYETAIGVATSDKNGLMSSSDKTKLDGVESGAQVNVQADWNQSDTTAKDYIKNKICYDFSGWKTVYSEVLEVDASDAIVSTFYPSYTYAYSVTSTSFMAGSTIRIAINDTYIDFVVPESSNNQWGEYTIGNYQVAIVGASNASSGPYIVGIGCKTDISGSTFSIQKYVNETKTIDEKYLPTYLDKLAYCTCTTAASTQAKVAACSVGQFTLTKGQKAVVKFSNANTAASPTLNIGSTGAKSIYWNGKALPSTQYWEAGAVLEFVYNGSQFELIGIAKDNSKEYSVATASSDGLFSATDKAKLDGIASGAGTDDIKYVAQALTEEQKAQARTNIGAAAGNQLTNGNALLEATDSNEYLTFTSSDPGHAELYSQGLYFEAIGENNSSGYSEVGFTNKEGMIFCGLRTTEGYRALEGDGSAFYGLKKLQLYNSGLTTNSSRPSNIEIITKNGDIQLLASGKLILGKSAEYSVPTSVIEVVSPMTIQTPTGDMNPTTKKYVDDAISTSVPDVATTEANGLMSVADKTKLDSISSNATAVTIKTWTAVDMT